MITREQWDAMTDIPRWDLFNAMQYEIAAADNAVDFDTTAYLEATHERIRGDNDRSALWDHARKNGIPSALLNDDEDMTYD